MKNFLLILVLISASPAFSQKSGCSKFRDGKFEIRDEGRTTIIRRHGNIQTEKMEGTKQGSRLHVTWIDECTYVLKPSKKTLRRRAGIMPADAALTVTITEVRENSYIQTTTSNFSDLKFTSEVTKID